MSLDSFRSARKFAVGENNYGYFSLPAAEKAGLGGISRLPYCLKVLLENQLRNEDGDIVTENSIRAFSQWIEAPGAGASIAFFPSRVMMQDTTGLPLLIDLADLREAGLERWVNSKVSLARPLDLVMDHSVYVDVAGRPDAVQQNMQLEFIRNKERYSFVRWAQGAFENLRVIPPGTGICHQVNMEYLARVVWSDAAQDGLQLVYPDTLVGGDSHTPMINAMGVVGWGVGGIEAISVALGQPVTLQIPEVVGCRLTGTLPAGVTATDLVLAVTERLRAKGVVQKFVEFFGPALANLSLTDRATLANMCPEYGASLAFFPVDQKTIDYLRLTGRDESQVALVEAYAKTQGLWSDPGVDDPDYSDTVEIDLSETVPCVSGPNRPEGRVPLTDLRKSVGETLKETPLGNSDIHPGNGDVVLAAITSCTNTANPKLMLAAGLLARRAGERGLTARPWVKTSLSPGSRVVADYLSSSGLQADLDALGFHITGYGCMTCAGGSGPLDAEIAAAIDADDLSVAAVLSGNRNFEGRINPHCKLAYLASPPLVVAFAIAGTVAIDFNHDPLGVDANGDTVMLADIWPDDETIEGFAAEHVKKTMFQDQYNGLKDGNERWDALFAPSGDTFDWDDESSMICRPPFLADTADQPSVTEDIISARCLVMLGDAITTDHISPAGQILSQSYAADYLRDLGVAPADFGTFMARRGNHDVMVRGTFANPRIRNELVPESRGGITRHWPSGETMTVYEAACRYGAENTPSIVIAGKEYGNGSSRDWAAKGTKLLGVQAVIAESFERIHRSNLIGMGVLPLQFPPGASRRSLELDGSESFDLVGLIPGAQIGGEVTLRINRQNGSVDEIELLCRLETSRDMAWFTHGGVMPMILRSLHNQA